MPRSSEQVVLAPHLGLETIVRAMIQRGLPLTRESYLHVSGLTEEEMTVELEANLPSEFQLTEDGEQPPEVTLASRSMTPQEYAEHLMGRPFSAEELQDPMPSTTAYLNARSTKSQTQDSSET